MVIDLYPVWQPFYSYSNLGYSPLAREAIMTTEIGNYLTKSEILSAI